MRSCLALLVGLVVHPALLAQDLGGGAPASHGRVPRFVWDRWIPGQAATLAFVDAPSAAPSGAAILSASATSISLPFVAGTLIADPAFGVVLSMGSSLPLGPVPASLAGRSLVVQGLLAEPAGLVFTDATRVNCYAPRAVVGNQRQTANSLQVLDVASGLVIDRIGDSENGSIALSRDRRRAYVCEPGSVRNRVIAYDISQVPAAQLAVIANTGGVRYRGEFSPDELRLYVPVHDGVDVLDTDPQSATYHTVLYKIPTPITGSATTIFTGPIDVAVTPDGSKLFIAYGESGATFPGTVSLGVVDPRTPAGTVRSIPITVGGVVNLLGNLATHTAVRISPDGRFAYVLEFGFKPGSFVNGFANGSLLKVVDVQTETEVAALATGGFGQSELELDFLGRNLWLAQVDLAGQGELVRFDVDRRSATRNTLRSRLSLDPLPFTQGGPSGAAATADGSTVLVTVIEDATHATPVVLRVDVATNAVVGAPIPVQSLPRTISCQR